MIQKILDSVDGYVVVANINSRKEAVIGGASDAVQEAMAKIKEQGYTVTQLQVSHAFHTGIVAEAADAEAVAVATAVVAVVAVVATVAVAVAATAAAVGIRSRHATQAAVRNPRLRPSYSARPRGRATYLR